MARANDLPILATELVTFLMTNQGQAIRRNVIAAYLTANTTTGATVSVTDVSEIDNYIRESIPFIPLVAGYDGLQLTMAFEPNRRYALRKVRTALTITRRLDRGHIASMLREQQRLIAAGLAPYFSQQEEQTLNNASAGLQAGLQNLILLEQALI